MTDNAFNRRKALAGGLLAGAGLPVVLAGNASAQPAAASTSTMEQVLKNKVLRAPAVAGQEPYFHKDLVSGAWSGACFDIAKGIADTLQVELKIVETTWGNQIIDLQSNKIDFCTMVNPTPERGLMMDFTRPILEPTCMAIVRDGFGTARTWADLNKPEVRIAIDLGSSHETMARRNAPRATILGFKTRDEALLALGSGRADCNIAFTILALTSVQKNPKLGKLVVLEPAIKFEACLGVRIESSSRFRDFLNTWIAYNRATGQTREWFLNGLKLVGVMPEDVPSNVTF
jgi:polar amino acid transport system substrate-binding protein